MTRDYSDEAYQKMINQIKEINDEQIDGVRDAIGDLGLHIGKWTGLIKTEDTEAYRKKMLDMNNITVDKLDKIFKKVKSTDKRKAKTVKKLGERQKEYNSKLASLSSLIEPEVSLPSVEEIQRICSKANGELKKADTEIDADYQKALKGMQKDVLLSALKGTTGSIVGTGAALLSMPKKMVKNFASGGPVKMAAGAASDTWGLINSVFAVGSGAVAIAAIGIGEVFVKGTGNTKYRELFLEEAEKYSKVEGLADAIIAGSGESKTTKAIKTASNTFEDATNATGVLKHIYRYAETGFDAYEAGGTENAIRNSFYEESKLLKDTKDILGEIDKYKN